MELCTEKIRGRRIAWWQRVSNRSDQIFLFLHGFPDTPQTFLKQIEHFSQDNDVVAPFLPGDEKESGAFGHFSNRRLGLRSMALDHLEILSRVNPEHTKKIVLVAHDIGTAHAWYLARLLGVRLRAMVILNGASLSQLLSRFKRPKQVRRSWYIFAFQVPRVSEWVLGRWGDLLMQGPADKKNLAIQRRGWITHYRQLLRDLPQDFHAQPIEAPVLALSGSEDPFVVPPTEAEMGRLSHHFVIRVLKGGHWLHEDEPDRVTGLIEEFLRESDVHA